MSENGKSDAGDMPQTRPQKKCEVCGADMAYGKMQCYGYRSAATFWKSEEKHMQSYKSILGREKNKPKYYYFRLIRNGGFLLDDDVKTELPAWYCPACRKLFVEPIDLSDYSDSIF